MKASEIKVGGFYVKNWQVREVYAVTERGTMLYRAYDVCNGEPHGEWGCSLDALARWAERPATPEETERLRIADAKQQQEERESLLRQTALRIISDNVSFAEVRPRGLKL